MKVYVFNSLPPVLWGYTRDLRALWTLEECGIAYQTVGLVCGPNGLADELGFEKISPFKQLPVIDDDGYILTESGAILMYLAEKSGKLIPNDLKARAQVMRWLITALSNIEPFAMPVLFSDMQGDSNPHLKALRPWNAEIVKRFLSKIDEILATQPFLTGTSFTVADVMMTCVLRELRKTELLELFPNVVNHRRRCEERPAFVNMLDAYEDRLGIPRGRAR